MAGNFEAAVLADGQLPNAEATIYTVPASTTVYVKRFSLFNTSTGDTQTVVVRLNVTGTPRTWRRYVLEPLASAELLEHGDALMLEAGDLIRAYTSDATTVDFIISGVKET